MIARSLSPQTAQEEIVTLPELFFTGIEKIPFIFLNGDQSILEERTSLTRTRFSASNLYRCDPRGRRSYHFGRATGAARRPRSADASIWDVSESPLQRTPAERPQPVVQFILPRSTGWRSAPKIFCEILRLHMIVSCQRKAERSAKSGGHPFTT